MSKRVFWIVWCAFMLLQAWIQFPTKVKLEEAVSECFKAGIILVTLYLCELVWGSTVGVKR